MTAATVTKTTAASEAPPETSGWPIAEQLLAENPAWLDYFTSRDAIAILEAAPDVTIASGILAEFDHLAEAIDRGREADTALVGGWHADAWDATFAASRKPAPGPEPEELPGVLDPLPELDGDGEAAMTRLIDAWDSENDDPDDDFGDGETTAA